MNKRYSITLDLFVPGEANPRFGTLSRSESDKGRVIGGDVGDLEFRGFIVEDGRTVLVDPVLVTNLNSDLSPDDAFILAHNILYESFQSIGFDAVERS